MKKALALLAIAAMLLCGACSAHKDAAGKSLDINSHLDRRVVARQMRQAILSYMQSDDFNPSLTLEPQVITDFFTKDGPQVSMFTKESPDELKPKLK